MEANFRVKLGAVFPDFPCETTQGEFTFHEFLSREPAWTMLFSHPKDFTPVCTTELGMCHSMAKQFQDMGVKMIGLSCDPVAEHREWSKDVLANSGAEGCDLAFPLIADQTRKIAEMCGMLDPLERDAAGLPMPARALFLIGPDKTNRLTILYPATTGRNFQEVARVIQSLFLTQDFKLATPVNWCSGDRCIVAPPVPMDEAREKFQNLEVKVLPSGKEYLRYVDCPAAAPSAVASAAPPASSAEDGGFKIKLGADFPDFDCETTKGSFKFHEFLERDPKWTVLFSHPKDFTPVCTTELGACHNLAAQLTAKGVKLIGLSCDSVAEHVEWSKDVLANLGAEGSELNFPLIADERRTIAASLGMLDPLERDGAGLPMPARALFIIGPDKKNRLTVLYPATTGRNFVEILRVVDSLFLTQDFLLATPVNWEQGQRVIVAPSVTTEVATDKFTNLETKSLPSGKGYLRYVDCPSAVAA